jgi:hypothetical protein
VAARLRREKAVASSRQPSLVVAVVLVALLGTACAALSNRGTTSSLARERVDAVAREVDAWARATTLADARAHAAAAADLVVGPGGLGYDGRARDLRQGLLPGPDGEPRGVALSTIGDAVCVQRDVLGGDWADARARWGELDRAIEEWAPDHNTFPSLRAHPMRVVGWATLTRSGSLAQALEYSTHARLHVDVTRAALERCCLPG